MATEKLYKVKIIGLHKKKAQLLDQLHQHGFMHLEEPSEDMQNDEPMPVIESISSALLNMKWVIESTEKYTKKVKPVFSNQSQEYVLGESKLLMEGIKKKLSESLSKEKEFKENLEVLESRRDLLKDIKLPLTANIEYPLVTDKTFTYLVKTSKPLETKDLKDKIIFNECEKYAILTGLARDLNDVEKLLRENQAKIIKLKPITQTKEKELINLELQIQENSTNLSKVEDKLSKLSTQYYARAKQIHHDLTILHERYEVPKSFKKTQKAFYAQGFLPVKQFPLLSQAASKLHMHVSVEEVVEGPTMLSNQGYVKHYEFLTKMFGVPKYGMIDPTPFMAFFIPLFFGFMFSDIGYGLFLLIGAAILYKKSDAEQKVFLDASVVLSTCAITTIIFGWLFGSFFGNLIKITPLLFDPFTNAKLVLIGGLALGLIHLNLGLLLGIIDSLKRKEIMQAFINFSPFIILQLAAAAYFKSTKLGIIMTIIMFISFYIRGKLQSLMDITGFVGTWFSYARLLALSLATGGIALGVNIMAEQLNQINVLGPILFVVVLVLGHAFNFLMNVLGSTIHSVRLHYIEFFSQFYTGEGTPYKPFTTKKIRETL